MNAACTGLKARLQRNMHIIEHCNKSASKRCPLAFYVGFYPPTQTPKIMKSKSTIVRETSIKKLLHCLKNFTYNLIWPFIMCLCLRLTLRGIARFLFKLYENTLAEEYIYSHDGNRGQPRAVAFESEVVKLNFKALDGMEYNH